MASASNTLNLKCPPFSANSLNKRCVLPSEHELIPPRRQEQTQIPQRVKFTQRLPKLLDPLIRPRPPAPDRQYSNVPCVPLQRAEHGAKGAAPAGKCVPVHWEFAPEVRGGEVGEGGGGDGEGFEGCG